MGKNPIAANYHYIAIFIYHIVTNFVRRALVPGVVVLRIVNFNALKFAHSKVISWQNKIMLQRICDEIWWCRIGYEFRLFYIFVNIYMYIAIDASILPAVVFF